VLNTSAPPWQIRADQPREALLEWARNRCPDLRIVHRVDTTVDGETVRACLAVFTLAGEEHTIEVTQSAESPDPADAVVRKVAEFIWTHLGVPAPKPNFDARRLELERAIMAAAQRGDAATADRLGAEWASLGNASFITR
jgi:hypothetical protein